MGAPSSLGAEPANPQATQLVVKPVMTNIVHTGVWEGPYRWRGVSVEDERKYAAQSFARWSEGLRKTSMSSRADIRLLEPAQITFSEDFVIDKRQFEKLAADAKQTDVFFLHPTG